MSSPSLSGTRRLERAGPGMPASDGAGVRLNRLIGRPGLADLDPFLMLDEFRSDSASDYIAGFPDHPHRGFETVTYMLAGRMRHGDNKGNSGLLRPGSVQWMTAGRGIVHSEMPEQEDGLMWGFQLWVNLPAADKMTAPRYQNIEPEAIPAIDLPGGVRVYPFEGTVRVGEDDDTSTLERGRIGVLSSGDTIVVATGGNAPARLLLVAGRPLREPIAKYGPFVMNTQAQIVQAIQDYNAGRF